jgi:hypothetical protein
MVDKKEETVETEVEAPKYITHEDLNKAFDARFSKFATKIESKFDSILQMGREGNTNPVASSPGGEETEVSKLRRELAEEKKSRKESEKKQKLERFHNEIGLSLVGKVVDGWQDVALDRIKQYTKVENDKPYIELDGLEYTVSEGIQEWLKKPENKRFLPVPVNTRTKTSLNPVISGQKYDEESVLKEHLKNKNIKDFFD